MKLISKKQYEEWKELEKKYAADETALDMLQKHTNDIMDEYEKLDRTHKEYRQLAEDTIMKYQNINRELGDQVELTKKELKTTKAKLTKATNELKRMKGDK